MKVYFLSKKTMVIIAAILVVIILSLVFMTSKGEGLASVFNAQEKLLPIYSVDKEDKTIAISFDAAWGDEFTQEILDILKKEDIKTTFFLVGMWVDKYPEQVQAIADAGHEIGNHSSSHPDMTKLDKNKMKEELNSTNEKISKYKELDTFLFRPPFGAYNNDLIKTVEELGGYTIQWDVDSLDWKNEGAEQIVNRVVSNVKPGSIVLFHNNAEYTTQALPTIIKELKDQGYTIVPISELIYKENYTMDHTGKQIQNNVKN
ncbi:polysaccharide deacetylase family sporulation protein PdaB [Alkalibaculum bacchi]|uniref:Polysaccharide deacetylase family sporulation protein PdaB n=1 Tax=Alkalibaculum bacchi TaxID=645887 RepID=A0A366I5T6_9FIRM|nr:polysaccharide deacetylase family sporulation protein PdaB [Alkalibaculum bacchi]RBP63853.1 polysaccharide deacetylase family sporulation protein PdaB [Alkalibaculum bacchi]